MKISEMKEVFYQQYGGTSAPADKWHFDKHVARVSHERNGRRDVRHQAASLDAFVGTRINFNWIS